MTTTSAPEMTSAQPQATIKEWKEIVAPFYSTFVFSSKGHRLARATATTGRVYAPSVVTDLEAALSPDSPLVHAGWSDYGSADPIVRDRNDASFSSIAKGSAEAAMATADVVVTSRYVADGCHAAPIEPRAVVAQWEGDKVTIWTSTQVPFDARAGVCETLGLPANRVVELGSQVEI